jgi:hypothetical protein
VSYSQLFSYYYLFSFRVLFHGTFWFSCIIYLRVPPNIHYPDNVSTPTADLTTAKVLLNSVVSAPQAKFIVTDIKDFYLSTKMKRYKYMRLPLTVIPPVIIVQYNLLPLVHDGYVYMEIRKGMYGLPQTGILANKKLTKHLAPYG